MLLSPNWLLSPIFMRQSMQGYNNDMSDPVPTPADEAARLIVPLVQRHSRRANPRFRAVFVYTLVIISDRLLADSIKGFNVIQWSELTELQR